MTDIYSMYYTFHAFNFAVYHTKENIGKLLTLQYTDAVTIDAVSMDAVHVCTTILD